MLTGRILVVGIGNPLRGDDGFGPALAQRLAGYPGILAIDAGTAPENHLGPLRRAEVDTILVVDSGCLGREPGEWEIVEQEEAFAPGFTTHAPSPALFLDYLRASTSARIVLLAVQAKSLTLGAPMTPRVQSTLDVLVRAIAEMASAP